MLSDGKKPHAAGRALTQKSITVPKSKALDSTRIRLGSTRNGDTFSPSNGQEMSLSLVTSLEAHTIGRIFKIKKTISK